MTDVKMPDIISVIALVTSIVALLWNIVRDMIVDRVILEVKMTLGVITPVVTTQKSLFVSISELPPETTGIEVLFSITNTGRRNIVVEKISGEYNVPAPDRRGFFFTARGLPKLLEPYHTHSEFSSDQRLVRELTEGKISAVYAMDTKGKKWFVPDKKLKQLVQEYTSWKAGTSKVKG